MNTAMENAIGLYMDGIRDGRPREAVATYTGARYTQHSTGVGDGPEGFIAFFEPFIERNPDRSIELVRALQDGQYVFVHADQSLNGGEARWVTMDFFDSDEQGKIIEHWDVIEAGGKTNAAGRTKVDGPTEVNDLEQTERNKELVRAFVDEVLIERRLERAHELVSANTFIQHGDEVGDGLDAFLTYYGAEDCPLTYQECFLLVGEGNFVATLNKARRGEQELCRVDLFRVEGAKIVEHWDNTEPVPPESEWTNSGKF